MVNYIEMISSSVPYNLYYAPFIMSLFLSKTSFLVRACLTKQRSYQPFGASKHVLQIMMSMMKPNMNMLMLLMLLKNPQPQQWGPPPMNLLDPLMPHIMNAIQQGMQGGMGNFQSTYNEQYHQSVMQHFEALNINLGTVQNNVDSLTTHFGNLSTNVQSIQQQLIDFSDHFYNVFPRGPPPLGYMSYPYYHPMSAQPPPKDDEWLFEYFMPMGE
jgi:hypothetical protein